MRTLLRRAGYAFQFYIDIAKGVYTRAIQETKWGWVRMIETIRWFINN